MATISELFAKQHEKEDSLKQNTIKEMLKLHRKTLTIVSNLKLKNIDISLDVHTGKDTTCSVTIYSRQSGENRSFTAYSFWSVEKNKKLFDQAVKLIKTDDFRKVITLKN